MASTPKPQAASGYIPNLINGISQQPANIRFPSQADECVNMMPTIQEQLARRNPLEILFKLENFYPNIIAGKPLGLLLSLTQSAMPYVHWYRRDSSEAYSVILGGDAIKVYSLSDGSEKSVAMSVPGNDSYHQSPTPEEDFYCYTFKDTTFIINRSVTPQMISSNVGTPIGLLLSLTTAISPLTSSRNPECLIKVKDAANGYTYAGSITMGGTNTTFSITAGASDTVNTVASAIQSAITAWASGNGGTATVKGNVVHLTHPTAAISLNTTDNRGGTALMGFTDTIQKSSDLPFYAPNGYVVKVTGTTTSQSGQDANTADDVIYRFVTDDGTSFASGVWQEGAAEGIKQTIDPKTMPHKLVRQSDGTFIYSQITWEDRLVGDEDTNPDPAFIDNPIHSCYLASNRLGFCAGGGSVLSKAEEHNYFDFWKTTILTTLDTDPVTMPVPSPQVNKTRWGIQWNGELILFGELLDGAVSWQSTLAPNKINIDTPTNFGISPLVPPRLSGGSLFFPKNREDYTILYEYKLDPITSLKDADNLTEYAGSYIPRDVVRLEGTEKDFLSMLCKSDRTRLYNYNYSRKNSKLVQQAFHHWEFNSNITIFSHFVEGGKMWVLFGFQSNVFIGQILISTGAKDTGLPGKCYMDFRISESWSGVSTSYSSGTNRTTVTLPFSYGSNTKAFELRDTFSGFPKGHLPTIESQTATTMVLVGDWTGSKFYVGLKYGSHYVPCEFLVYTANADRTGTVVDDWKRVQLKRLMLRYNTTGYFRIEVYREADNQLVHTAEMPLRFDNIESQYDSYTLYKGAYLTSIFKATRNHKVKIINDSTKPSYFTGIGWYGEYWDATA